ncbi:Fructosamine kinase-domain-containing protein [Nemania abortiva]|nr:Fructosamine kinase-domain-containing protein [Nemania abortiva]
MSGLTGMPVPKKQDMFTVVNVDEAVAKHFPPGSKLISARPHGASFWTRTARLDVELADKSECKFFLKVSTGDVGLGMLRGEFYGVTAMYKFIPDGVPRPVGWGTYVSDPDTHFYLCEFIEMIEELPDIRKFSVMLAKLHHNSMVSSDAPTKFGFPIVTYEGKMHQDVTWCATWEESFSRQTKAFADQEILSQGPSQELDTLWPLYFKNVIPRLLRPLESHGRKIKPALIHNDIWYGNIAINAETGEPVIFDPAMFWGHNESDLGNMNTSRYRLGRHWMREYHKNFPVSPPEEDYGDRNAVYAIRGHLVASTLYPGNNNFRRMLIAEIKRLVEKYPNGYQGE